MNQDLAEVARLDAFIERLTVRLIAIASDPLSGSGSEYKLVLRLLHIAHEKRSELLDTEINRLERCTYTWVDRLASAKDRCDNLAIIKCEVELTRYLTELKDAQTKRHPRQ